MQILIIDDDVALCRSMQIQLESEGHSVDVVHNGADGLSHIDSAKPDLLFLDLNLPDTTGLHVLRKLQDKKCESVIIMITGVQDAKSTIEAIRSGAFDYIRKPLDLDAVLLAIEKAGRRLKSRRAASGQVVTQIDQLESPPHEIVGADEKIIDILKQIALLSENRIPVLIQGESGTGKELVARALHETACPREPFVAVNCSAIVPTLLESELFGHVKGAFTGADTSKSGKLKYVGAGTLFLDEIGDMSYELQAKLLRVLQEREFEPVGGTEVLPFKARVVAATHRDLASMVAEGEFREDLYYRLAVSTIRVPPLREHLSDLPLLTQHVLARINRELHKEFSGVEEPALRRIQMYDWPGNVRELINVLTRAALLCRGRVLTEEAVVTALGRGIQSVAPPTEIKTLREAEKEHIEKALLFTGWNITQTAAMLETSRVTLRRRIDEFGLRRPPNLQRADEVP